MLIFILTSAWRALGRHRLRAALTMLGIAIGIAAVIAMVSLGQGAHQAVVNELESMGNNLLYVEAGNRVVQGVSTARDSMTYENVVAVRKDCPAVAMASPHVNFRSQVITDGRNWNTQIRGIDPEFQRIRNWPVVEGIFLPPSSMTSAAKVAVVGQRAASELFSSSTNPIGQTIRIGGLPFEVVGLLAAKGASVTGDDQDDVVLIPWTTAQRRVLGIKYIKDMFVSAGSRDTIEEAKKQVTALLRQRHHLTGDQPDDFSFRDYTEIAESVNETNRLMTLLLSSVAAIALLVGGINTMTIMLVSVTERTREIGVRMAIGGRVHHIRLQFLIEAVLLTLVGGLAGAVLGVGGSYIVGDVLRWPPVISPVTVALGLVMSTVVGLVFGYYPAFRASLMDPIEALRSD